MSPDRPHAPPAARARRLLAIAFGLLLMLLAVFLRDAGVVLGLVTLIGPLAVVVGCASWLFPHAFVRGADWADLTRSQRQIQATSAALGVAAGVVYLVTLLFF